MGGARTFGNVSAGQGPTATRRSALLGMVLGLLGVAVWAQRQQQAVEELLGQLSRQQGELAGLQAAGAQAAERIARQQAARAELGRLQAAQQGRTHLLAILEDLAQAGGPRLVLLRLDAQGLRLQGQAAAEELEAWMLQRPTGAVGLGPPQLAELTRVQGEPTLRFTLTWPRLAGKAAP